MSTGAIPRPLRRRLLVGTSAHNGHVQNMVKRALRDRRALRVFLGRRGRLAQRRRCGACASGWAAACPAGPRVVAAFGRRHSRRFRARRDWRWELPRVIAGRFNAGDPRRGLAVGAGRARSRSAVRARGRASPRSTASSVSSTARCSDRNRARRGKPSVLAFLSPHHRARASVGSTREFDPAPELGTPGRARYLDHLSESRDARRDDEARLADWIVERLVVHDALARRRRILDRIDPDRFRSAAPNPCPSSALPRAAAHDQRLVYVGPVSVRKGAHYLLRAWRQTAPPGRRAALLRQAAAAGRAARRGQGQPRR